jgi:hypothetical protein
VKPQAITPGNWHSNKRVAKGLPRCELHQTFFSLCCGLMLSRQLTLDNLAIYRWNAQ